MRVQLEQLLKGVVIGCICSVFLLVSACSDSGSGNGGGDKDGGNSGKTTGSLSGIIKQSSGQPLEGATVTLTPTGRSATTDASGQFIISGVAAAKYMVKIDGSTGVVSSNARFGTLAVIASVVAEENSSLEQVVFLPNLNSVVTATSTVAITNGVSDAEITAVKGQVSLRGAASTRIKLDDVDASQSVEVSATPVPLSQLPMVLDSGEANAADFVTIQPSNATFDPPLDLRIPNTQNLPLGTKVNIWSFDHDIEAWVNRSAETGNKGTVVDDGEGGTIIEALGVITKGGWHGPTAPPVVLTTVTGTVVDALGNPLGGVFLFTNSGQGGVSAADGRFTINNVTSDPVVLTLTASVALGGFSTSVVQAAIDRGITDFGTITLAVPSVGQVAGRALSLRGASTQAVTITGPGEVKTVTPAADGTFFLADLAPGEYTASITFNGDSAPTSASFTVLAGQISFILLQQPAIGGGGGGPGTGDNAITVKVFYVDDELVNAQVANNTDLLTKVQVHQASNNLSENTDATGIASFNINPGAFSVTVQRDIQSDIQNGEVTLRAATTQFFDNPPANGQIGIMVFDRFFVSLDNAGDGSISGSITNIPDLADGYQLVVKAEPINESDNNFDNRVTVLAGPIASPGTREYTLDSIKQGTYKVWAEIYRESFVNGDPGEFLRTRDFDAAAILVTTVDVTVNNVTPIPALDFGNAGMAVSFSQKNINVTNIDSAITGLSNTLVNYSVDSWVSTIDGHAFYFDSFFGRGFGGIPAAGSFVSDYPNTLTNSLAEFEVDAFAVNTIQGRQVRDDMWQSTSVLLTDAGDVSFDLLNLPVFNQPAPDVVEFTQAQLSGLNIAWSGAGASDLNFVIMSGIDNPATPLINESGIAGIDSLLWFMFLPGGNKSMSVPDTELPMFGIDGAYNFQVSENVMSGGLNYDQAFNHDVVTNLTNAFQNGESSSQRGFNAFAVTTP